MKQTLSMSEAQQIIARAISKADEMKLPVCIAVVDDGAHLNAFARMDGSFPGAIDVCQRKARTAALFHLDTGVFGQVIEGASLTGMELTNGGLAAFPGGLPITADGEVIGGIGISGGSAEQDLEVAQFALKESN